MSTTGPFDEFLAGHLAILGGAQRRIAVLTGLSRHEIQKSRTAVLSDVHTTRWLRRLIELCHLANPQHQQLSVEHKARSGTIYDRQGIACPDDKTLQL